MSVRLAEIAGSLLERRTSRRGLLARAALGASAMAVAPVRYLLEPISAWAAIGPGDCGQQSLCNDGYTAFCCEINQGKNVCPEHTYVAGWWKCTAYRGRGLCEKEGVRYYVDCNRIPGQSFGPCRCAHNSCDERRVNCNVFRYGQCNTQVPGVTEVSCRVVVCQHPAEIDGFNCNSSLAVDDNTCRHNRRCLTPLVSQLPGAGGA